MPDVMPQVAGLVLPEDVLMLAQAAAGDGDLVDWLCATIRHAVTPTAASVTLTGRLRDGQPAAVTDAAPLTAAQRQAKRRAALAADPAAKAAEAERKRASRAHKTKQPKEM